MLAFLGVAAGVWLDSVGTFDGQGTQCAQAYGQELSLEPAKQTFDIPEDGCYRVEVYQPDCDFTAGAIDVNYCKGGHAQVMPGDVKGWVPIGVWPFYTTHGGSIAHDGAHDAARVVFVGSLASGCHFEEPRLARIHLAADFAQLPADFAEQAALLLRFNAKAWTGAGVRLLGVSAGSVGPTLSQVVVDVELRPDSEIGGCTTCVRELCALAGADNLQCVTETMAFVQERVGDVRQVRMTDVAEESVQALKLEEVQVLPAAMTYDGRGEHCAAAYGKSFAPAASSATFAIPQDGCYRVDVYQPDCDFTPGAFDVHFCKGRVAQIGALETKGWVPVGVWPFYTANGGSIAYDGAHDAARVVFVGSIANGCRFEEPRLARIHLAADFSQVTDPQAFAKAAEAQLRLSWGPVKVLGVSAGSVVVDVELGSGAAATVGVVAKLCDLVATRRAAAQLGSADPDCPTESTIFVQERVGAVLEVRDVEPEVSSSGASGAAAGGSSSPLGPIVGACVVLGLLPLIHAILKQRKNEAAALASISRVVEPADAEKGQPGFGSFAPHTPSVKPQDDDLCSNAASTATPGSEGPDLGTSLGSTRYTCGSTSVGVVAA